MKLERPIAAVLQSASLVGVADVREEAVGLLSGGMELVGCAVGVLRATPVSRWRSMDLDAVAAHCTGVLESRLDRPARAADDWSIELPEGCSCELCAGLRTFLYDPPRKALEWPLAQDRRAHVHRRIETAELPVTHQTRRRGRPYTLILTKTDQLFERERQQRRRDEADLAWLDRNRAVLAGRKVGSKYRR
jgi:hypothetical protein